MQKVVSAKDIKLHVIDAKSANAFVKRHHYSGKVVPNSQLHFGAFLDGKLHGVMSFGPSMDKRKVQTLVRDTGWNEFIELNRMAFDDHLPKNSESRCIAIAMRLLKKHAPQIKWVISFADGTQCGDGTIYRASGFVLTDIRPNQNTVQLPSGEVVHKMTLESSPLQPRQELDGKSYYDLTGGKYNLKKYAQHTGGKVLTGFQLRYVYFIDQTYKEKINVNILPYSRIEEMGASMYLGKTTLKKD